MEANGYPTIGDCEEMVQSFPNGDNDTEGPALVANPSIHGFVLFFVVGFYKNTDYRNDYATADQITGPYQRQGILLKTGTYQGVNITAPGEPDLMGTSATEMILMGDKDSSYGLREMYTAQLTYDGHRVSLATSQENMSMAFVSFQYLIILASIPNGAGTMESWFCPYFMGQKSSPSAGHTA